MKKTFRFLFRPHWKKLIWFGGLLLLWIFSLPHPLFDTPYSTVIEDRSGNLLGARIASDGQWRFPPMDTVPEKFAQAITTFEDQYFYSHPGVNLGALGRAVMQNVRNRRVVSGGSTLTMQLVRLSRGNKSRNLWEKAVEAWVATRIEASYSKSEILALYASHAPFGGNVVGLDAAAWRYYGRKSHQLSWGESALLAVLPNAPAMIHPGKNRDKLRAKRDRLLDRMYEAELFDSLTCALAKAEPLPAAPHPLPQFAPHMLDRIQMEGGLGQRTETTLDVHLQQQVAGILERHQNRLQENGIHNAAAIVLEVASGDVLAYQGNVLSAGAEHGHLVDVVNAPRSTGSILKPFLYASMLDDGAILPNTLVPDIPTYFGSYSPKNYHRSYDGAVPAHRALARSLNIPAVRMLHKYGHQRFHHRLQEAGMSTLNRSADHYGLSLILGGSEATLWDLAGMYASLARSVNQYAEHHGQYESDCFRAPNFRRDSSMAYRMEPQLQKDNVFGAGAAWLTLKAMVEVTRPGAEQNWESFSSSRRIAWKTGTSYGYRDAWAIGCTPTHVVAVWVGNADGEGRPGLVGLHAAAPILFNIYDALPAAPHWFETPYDDLEEIEVCRQSGHRAGAHCAEKTLMQVPLRGLESSPCPYHQMVHLEASGQFRVHSECASPSNMVHKSWFVLPPAQEEWYQKKHVDYVKLPPFDAACGNLADAEGSNKPMEFIYPSKGREVYVPIDLDGKRSQVVFEVAHRDQQRKIHWHLDADYLGSTLDLHQMALQPKAGKHTLTLVDDLGSRITRSFTVLERQKGT